MISFFKTFRIILAILLFAQIMPSEITKAAQADNETKSKVERRLAGFGIIDVNQGDIDPNREITRAELAAMVVRAMGLNALASNEESAFSDVPATHPLLAYINAAVDLGIISGVSRTRFAPNDSITFPQVAKILVCALGYKVKAENDGGYPSGYESNAITLGLTRGVGSLGTKALTYEQAMQIVFNALEVPKTVPILIGDPDTSYTVPSGDNQQTLLNANLGFEEYKTKIIRSNNGMATVEILIDKSIKAGKRKYPQGGHVSVQLPEGVSFQGLENAVVRIWVKQDVIVYYELETTIVFDYIGKINKEYEEGDFDISLDKVSEVYLVSTKATYGVDTKEIRVSLNESQELSSLTQDCLSWFARLLISTEGIYEIGFYQLMEGGIIESFNEEDLLYFTMGDLKGASLMETVKLSDSKTIIDGEPATFEDLEEKMFFEYCILDTEFLIVASSKIADGVLSEFNSNAVVIRNAAFETINEYFLSGRYYVSYDFGATYALSRPIESLAGQEVQVILDAAGRIRYVEGQVASYLADFYGVVMGGETTLSGSRLKVYRELNGQGLSVVYDLKLRKDSSVKAEQAISNARKIDGSGIYKFSLNAHQEINRIEAVSWLNQDTTKYEPTPDFHGYQWKDGVRIDAQINQFDGINLRTIVTRRVSPVGGANPQTHQYSVDMRGKTLFSMCDIDGNFAPSVVDFLDIQNKVRDGMIMRISSDEKGGVMAITHGFYGMRSSAIYYGVVTNKSMMQNDYFRLTIRGSAGISSYTAHKSNLDSVYWDMNNNGMVDGTEKRYTAEVNDIVLYSLGGSVLEVDEDNETETVEGDGTIKIVAVYRVTGDSWGVRSGYLANSLNDFYPVIQDIDTVNRFIQYSANLSEAHETAGLAPINFSDFVDLNCLILEIDQDLKKLTPRRLNDLSVTDSMWALQNNNLLRAIVFMK